MTLTYCTYCKKNTQLSEESYEIGSFLFIPFYGITVVHNICAKRALKNKQKGVRRERAM